MPLKALLLLLLPMKVSVHWPKWWLLSGRAIERALWWAWLLGCRPHQPAHPAPANTKQPRWQHALQRVGIGEGMSCDPRSHAALHSL
jgi:hypothetical protein